ncbi:MAG: hypothetical protein WKG07_01195 [Hymenobacter sp.]
MKPLQCCKFVFAAHQEIETYTYVELMPRLRTAAGYQNISEAIQQR